MRLSDDELRDVLNRAEEIEHSSVRKTVAQSEMNAVIAAGMEIGLSRSAIERALREHLDLTAMAPEVGDLAFARSADGKYYVAEVLSATDENARVRFLRGTEHTVAIHDLKSCALLPGEKVMVEWPWWGPWKCTVVSYDSVARSVRVADGWGSTYAAPLTEIWLNPPKKDDGNPRARIYATLLGVGAAGGALIAGLVALLVR